MWSKVSAIGYILAQNTRTSPGSSWHLELALQESCIRQRKDSTINVRTGVEETYAFGRCPSVQPKAPDDDIAGWR